MLLKIIAFPLLLYRVFFKKWANIQEHKFKNYLNQRPINGQQVYFAPELPNKRVTLSNALKYLGFSIKHGNAPNQINIAWHDQTYKAHDPNTANHINGNCTNISKSYLDQVHLKVFGYGVNLNPKLFKGAILEKSELNGKHDAKIITAPTNPKPNYVYQHIINTRKGLLYEDLRPVVINGEIPLTFLNYRVAGKRFSAKKIKAKLAETDDCFNKKEQKQILELCQQMGANIAELDVLRDKKTGKIFVVDLNTTAFGPAHGLSFNQKIKAIEKYSKSLNRYLNKIMARDSF
ncbi:MAG: hypothetical protein ACPGLV_16400 [Bacteroidia bacterium]